MLQFGTSVFNIFTDSILIASQGKNKDFLSKRNLNMMMRALTMPSCHWDESTSHAYLVFLLGMKIIAQHEDHHVCLRA